MDKVHKVLIVDDFESTRAFIRYILVDAGFQATVVSTGNKALDEIDDQMFDLIITDINLPDMDGFDFISEVQANERFRNTPIMVVSMDITKKSQQRGEAVGVSKWFSKPISPSKLIEYIKGMTLSQLENDF